MPNYLPRIQSFIQQNRKLVGVFLILQIIFIALIVTSILNLPSNSYEPANTPVTGISLEIESLPTDSADTIQEFLYNAIAMNGGTPDSLQDSSVQIRPESLINLYFENINMHYVNFIVDIPSLEQSYQIFHEWSDDNSNKYYLVNMATLIMCPTTDQVKYSNFNCKDKFNHQGQNYIVSEFIRYYNFNYFTVSIHGDYSQVDINPIKLDVSDSEKDSYIQKTKSTIQSLGIYPEIFTYHIVDPAELNYDNSGL